MRQVEIAEATQAFAPTSVADQDAWVSEYLANAKAPNTKRAYAADWSHFIAWCGRVGACPIPAHPDEVARYAAHLAKAKGFKASTIQRRMTAIAQAHRAGGHESPTSSLKVQTVMTAIRREKGMKPAAKVPLLTMELRSMVMAIDDRLIGARDRALLLVGFAGAFRRSELVALARKDVKIDSNGATILVRRSKTDQEGDGAKKGIPYGRDPRTCPVRALQTWFDLAGIEDGPIFRPIDRHGRMQPEALSDKAVARIVKRRAAAVGLDPAALGGHSLRAGMATQAAMAGASERVIMNQTGHRSLSTVRRYIRDGSLFRENAADSLGL